MSQGTQTGALDQPRGVGWGGRWEAGSRGREKEKDKYRILTNIYGIQKTGTEEFIYRATVEKQT